MPYLTAPSGLILVGELTQGKPWAMLSWPFGPQRTVAICSVRHLQSLIQS
jgi:hypothetical protein